MAITRPFAINTGSAISGTSQVGNIAIGVDALNYSAQPGGVVWYMGPDEDPGYVIAYQNGTQPTFWRTSAKTDLDFVQLANSLPARVGQSPFLTPLDATTWLDANGYWHNLLGGVSYGTLGVTTSLPFANYTWNPFEIVGTYFTSTQSATAYQQNIKAVATNPGTLVNAYLYLQTGVGNGSLIATSSSTLTIGTTPVTLNFPISAALTSGSSYYLLFQANNFINYYYDNAPSSYYVNIGAPAFGSPPSSFAGVFTNVNILESSLDYYW